MSLKELLLRRAAGAGNIGSTATGPLVTRKTFSDQSGSNGNAGNADFGHGRETRADGSTATAVKQDILVKLDSRDLPSMCVTHVTHVTMLENKEKTGNTRQAADVTRVTFGVEPAASPQGKPAADRGRSPSWREPNLPTPGSLVGRLAAAGATVRVWDGGDQSHVELPAGISAELLHEVEARGWRIIAGGRANPEAVHDSWLAGVPIAELDP